MNKNKDKNLKLKIFFEKSSLETYKISKICKNILKLL